MKRTLPACVAALLPGLALGQSTITTTPVQYQRQLNASACDDETEISATLTYGGSVLNQTYTLFATNLDVNELVEQACRGSGDPLVDEETLTGPVSLPRDHSITLKQLLEPVCTDKGFFGTRLLCLKVKENNIGVGGYDTGGGVKFQVDTQVPGAPTKATWQPGDGAVVLTSLVQPDNTVANESLSFVVEVRPCDQRADEMDAGAADSHQGVDAALPDSAAADLGSAEDVAVEDAGPEDGPAEDAPWTDAAIMDSALPDTTDATAPDTADAAEPDAAEEDAGSSLEACGATGPFKAKVGTQLPVYFDGLENGRAYEVRLRVRDSFGNQGRPSASSVITPRPEFGFWDLYQGGETGCEGCASQGGRSGAGWVLLLVALGGLAARRHRRGGAALLLVAALSSVPARAEPFDLSARLNVGPFKPMIDSEPGANGVYACVFEDKTWMLLGGGLDLVLFDSFGTLSAGGAVHYFTVNGKERLTSGVGGSCGKPSASTNELHIVPLALTLHYRFDWPYRMWGFPLAPYARVGALATPWMLSRNGELENTGGASAGVRTGWQWALGLAFVLDAMDELRMRRVREEGTFQHAYLFAEWRDMRIDSFGEPGFRLGDATWMMGIAVDF